MEKSHLEDLRKKYPKEIYNIAEADGRVIITKKKRAIWIRKRLLTGLPHHDSAELTKAIENKLEIFDKNIDSGHFHKVQVLLTKELVDKLTTSAKKSKVKRIIYLTAVLE